MQEVWLFGDSYSQDSEIVSESTKHLINYEFVSWPNRLKEKYNLKNFSQGGSGPTWALNCLNKKIKENSSNLKDIDLIFFISAIWRLDLAFYKNLSDQCLTTKIPAPDTSMINFGWNIFHLNKEEKKSIKPYKKHTVFVKELWRQYLLTESFQNTELLKIIGNLRLYSDMFRKVLVWPIFHQPFIPVKSSNNFYYVDKLLFEIEKDPYGYGFDPRHNHLTEGNHNIMFTQICSWVDYSSPIDVGKFIKNELCNNRTY
jgi:hypothetical protein